MLNLQPGDHLEFPASTRALLGGANWIDAIDSAAPEKNCDKVFASPVSEGRTALGNLETGDRLEFAWNPTENASLGLWFTRGGWHGHHHFAIEPTNAGADALVSAASQASCGTVAAGDFTTWQIRLRAGT